MTTVELRDIFGGSWDGAAPEIHGLIERDGRKLKMELLHSRRRKIWSCSVFHQGACIGQASDSLPANAVRDALRVARVAKGD